MRVALLTLVAAVIVWISACGSSAASEDPTTWKLAFSDDFNGTTLDPQKWNTCYWWVFRGGCTNVRNREQQWYTAANVIVADGTLKLRAKRQTVVAPDGRVYRYTSGLISSGRTSRGQTTPKFQFKYGYMEMRAKAPRGAGLWPTFWTLPSNHDWPPEIDTMEMRGDRPNDVHLGVYTESRYGRTLHGDKWLTGGPDYTSDFHTFGVNWQPTFLAFYVDGVEHWRVTDKALIPAEPMYVLANLAVGGTWAGSPTASTPLPSDLEIDYIRVYEATGGPASNPPTSVQG